MIERSRRVTPRIGRPSKSEPFRSFVASLLAQDAEMRSSEILRRAVEAGYGGGKSALYDLIAALRPSRTEPAVARHIVPGEVSQHDLVICRVHLTDDAVLAAHVMASRLRYSGWIEASLVDRANTEAFVRTLVGHLERFGGTPRLSLFERTEGLAAAWDDEGRVTDWSPAFAQAVVDLGLAVEVVPPRPSVNPEPDVGLAAWIRGTFVERRRFTDLFDARAQLASWLAELNASGNAPVLLAEERRALRPLKRLSDELVVRVPVTVGREGKLVYEDETYVLPAEAEGASGILHLQPDRVRVVVGRTQHVLPRWCRGRRNTLIA